jgi:PHD/YefM family antitoxin component YafN of YafNO toxin-antitoxin module
MRHQLERAMELSRKTGDRLIVYDSGRPDATFVVVPFDDYERMALQKNDVRGLTEAELLDRINRDIALWKNDTGGDISLKDLFPGRYEDPDGLDDLEDLSDDELADLEDDETPSETDEHEVEGGTAPRSGGNEEAKPRNRNHWIIPDERKENAEEIIEEDRQYLETVPF